MKPGAVVVALMAASAILSSCESSGPTFPRPPVAVTPSPSPTPTTTPEPSPSPSASPNLPPRVTLTGGGACHPLPSRPCTVAFNAAVVDPEEDRIAYGWDGCAQGNAPLATCTVTAPGLVTATVLVTDGQGNFVRATGTAEGVNAPPFILLGAPRPPNPAPSNTVFSMVSNGPEDPDGDEHVAQLCARTTVTATGPCRAGFSACGTNFDVDIVTLQGPGTCAVEVRTLDLWGAAGVDRHVFQVLP